MLENLRSSLPLVAWIALAFCAGCRSGGSRLAETDGGGINVGGVPRQWEPSFDSEETAEISQTSAGDSTRGTGGKSGLTKWWRQKGSPKLPRIPLPRTDKPADDDEDKADDQMESGKSDFGKEPDFSL